MYDGFIEYLKTFLTKKIDNSIVKICKDKLNDLISEIQSLDYESSPENNEIKNEQIQDLQALQDLIRAVQPGVHIS